MSENIELELHRSVIDFAKAALNITLLMNGGAAIAILAFIGNIWSTNKDEALWVALACTISYFCLGLLASALGVTAAYFRQLFYSHDFLTNNPKPGDDHIQKMSKTTWCFHIFGVLMVLASIMLFGLGVYELFNALIHFAPTG